MESSSQPSTDANDQVNGVEEQLVDPMEDFSKQLEDIINQYGSVSTLMEEQISILEKEEEKLDEEIRIEDVAASVETGSSQGQAPTGEDASLLLQSLNQLSSAEEKVEMVLKKYAELLEEQKKEQKQMEVLQNRQGFLVKQKDQLQFEHSQGILVRGKLESLCRELQRYNKALKKDMLQKCQEDEKKRTEITTHFQSMLVDIQAQIEHHSNRNNKLCQENSDLADKLKSIIEQYEKREESLEKIFKQRDLQQKLSDTKLEEANLRLKEAEEKHSREKEYLLKEAIEKTKKCYTMKEQELQMKKQLVLYSQKFDEFQGTLAKSNEVYATFKQEMDKMTKKMKKLEKESNIWKIRFESCSKALTEMIEERSEKGKELELFTLKIGKLETLCRALQDERKVLYDKIKEIRLQGFAASAPLKGEAEEVLPELSQLSEPEAAPNPALTTEMEKLWKEQARLEEFAASLLFSTTDEMEDSEGEEPFEPIVSHVPVPSKPEAIKLQSITEKPSSLEGGNQITEEAQKSLVTISEPIKPDVILSEPKEEPIKQEIFKTETPKEEPTKEAVEKVEPVEQYTPKQKDKTKPVGQKEVRFKDMEAEIVPADPPKAESTKEELKAQDPKLDVKEDQNSTEPTKAQESKEESSIGEPPKEATNTEPGTAEVPKVEPVKEEPSTSEPVKAEMEPAPAPESEVAKPQTSKAQETKSKNNKPQPKKQGSSKKKSAAKSAKKS